MKEKVYRMKNAFTMIELIFVIVIIGILAAIAIPKLAVTRDDAKIATIVSNAKIILGDFQAFYTSNGNNGWKSENVNKATAVALGTACDSPMTATTELSPETFVLCSDDVICLSFSTIDEGNLTITDGTDTTDIICEAVKSDPVIVAISNKTYILGGKTVER